VEEIIKRVSVPRSLLTELDWESNGYLIRYRIISNNKNIRSHWSPTYFIPAEDFADVTGQFYETTSDSDPTKTVITAVWDDFFSRPAYDVFVAFRGNDPDNVFEFDGDQFYYHGRAYSHSYSFENRDGVESIRIVVQPASNKPIIKASFIIYDSEHPVVAES
jgi:hypothetical protein